MSPLLARAWLVTTSHCQATQVSRGQVGSGRTGSEGGGPGGRPHTDTPLRRTGTEHLVPGDPSYTPPVRPLDKAPRFTEPQFLHL